MRTAFKASVVANVVLGALALWLMSKPRSAGGRLTPASPAAATNNESTSESSKFLQKPGQEPRDGFHWSQLESSDYPTYIANLRSVGCPEETLRDIVIADVDSLYAHKREQIERNELQGDFQHLREEEALVLGKLLGSTSTPSTWVQPRRNRSLETPVLIPLAFQNVNADSANLTEQQAQVIADLRQRFHDELGGQAQDPKDTAYRKRWEPAQRDNDDLLQVMLGSEFFLEYQLQASRKAAQPQTNFTQQ
jgi:hypothetical protein